MKIFSLSKGFTLIELLVVVTIVGILSVGTFVAYGSYQEKGRDAVRLSDTKQITMAIETYNTDYFSYPSESSGTTASVVDAIKSLKTMGYMKRMPRDPLKGKIDTQGTPTDGLYEYIYTPAIGLVAAKFMGGDYEISARMENDKNRITKAANDNGDDDQRFEVGGEVGSIAITSGLSVQLNDIIELR